MKRRIEINDILMEFLADFETSGEEALRRYIEMYPDMADTLQRRVGILRMFSKLPETELSVEEEQTLNLRAASVVQNLVFEVKQQEAKGDGAKDQTEPVAPLTSLLDQLKALGETTQSVAAKLRVSDLIVEKLDKRRIRPGSVPGALYQMLAEILAINFEEVLSYANRAPAASSGHFRASSAPAVAQQPEFSELVRWDPEMLEEDKSYWLASPPLERA